MSTLQIGKANYSANRGEKMVYYRLGMKDNQRELTLRIAPPIKDLAEKGNFAVYNKQHFGYTLAGKGDKRFPVTFNCLERKDRSKNIVQNCPECDEISLRKADLEAKEAKLKADGVAAEIIEAQLRVGKAWLKEHNLDKKWYMLAKNESGQWGYLALGHKAFEDFQRELKELSAVGFSDPLSPEEGVWFRFTRTGSTFNDVKDSVAAVKLSAGKGQITIKTDTLTEKDFQALESMPSLSTLGRRITYEQISSLVQSGGDETVVKSVFESAQPRSETSAVKTNQPTRTVQTDAPAPIQTAAAPAPVTGGTNNQALSGSNTQDLMAQIAALQAQVAAVQKAPAQSRQPTPTLMKKLEVDPEEFLASFADDNE